MFLGGGTEAVRREIKERETKPNGRAHQQEGKKIDIETNWKENNRLDDR